MTEVFEMIITQLQSEGHISDRYHSFRGVLVIFFLFSWNHGVVDDRGTACSPTPTPNNNESVKAVQREFRRRFNIHRNQAVPTRSAIFLWVHALHTRGTLMNSSGYVPPENVECVRQPLLRSLDHFARRYATEFGTDNRSVRCILYEELHLHPCKLVTG